MALARHLCLCLCLRLHHHWSRCLQRSRRNCKPVRQHQHQLRRRLQRLYRQRRPCLPWHPLLYKLVAPCSTWPYQPRRHRQLRQRLWRLCRRRCRPRCACCEAFQALHLLLCRPQMLRRPRQMRRFRLRVGRRCRLCLHPRLHQQQRQRPVKRPLPHKCLRQVSRERPEAAAAAAHSHRRCRRSKRMAAAAAVLAAHLAVAARGTACSA